jgi:hypothetical protein
VTQAWFTCFPEVGFVLRTGDRVLHDVVGRQVQRVVVLAGRVRFPFVLLSHTCALHTPLRMGYAEGVSSVHEGGLLPSASVPSSSTPLCAGRRWLACYSSSSSRASSSRRRRHRQTQAMVKQQCAMPYGYSSERLPATNQPLPCSTSRHHIYGANIRSLHTGRSLQ